MRESTGDPHLRRADDAVAGPYPFRAAGPRPRRLRHRLHRVRGHGPAAEHRRRPAARASTRSRPRRPTRRPAGSSRPTRSASSSGAPTIAAAAARWPRKRLLLALLVAFTLGTIASALLPTFGLVLVARFVAALPHGAYFGIASLVAASLMGPGKRARGVALVLSGLTIANVIGVPAITWLGQAAGWRIAYLAVAGIFALTFVAVLLAVPWQPGDPARDHEARAAGLQPRRRCGSRSASARSASAGSSPCTATSPRSPPR